MEQSVGKNADVFWVLGVEGLEEAGGGLFVVLPVFGGLLPGLEEGVAAFFGGELGIVDSDADFLEEIGVVDERVAAVEGVVVEIVLAIFPVVGDHGIQFVAGHAITEDEARLVGGLFILCEIQIRGEAKKGLVLLHVHGIHNHHVRYAGSIPAIGVLAHQHWDEAAFGYGDIRLEDADSPTSAI